MKDIQEVRALIEEHGWQVTQTRRLDDPARDKQGRMVRDVSGAPLNADSVGGAVIESWGVSGLRTAEGARHTERQWFKLYRWPDGVLTFQDADPFPKSEISADDQAEFTRAIEGFVDADETLMGIRIHTIDIKHRRAFGVAVLRDVTGALVRQHVMIGESLNKKLMLTVIEDRTGRE